MTVRYLPEDVHRRIRLYAAARGMSAEAAVRRILDEAARPSDWAISSPPSPARAPPTSPRAHATTILEATNSGTPV